jgi:hypothetical protein
MDLFAPQNPALLALVAAGANRSTSVSDAWSAASVRDMLALDAALRPPGHAQDSRSFAARYLGNQEGIVRAALRHRYPLSAATMPIAPLNYIRQWARKDSGSYQQEPDRYLVSRADRSVVEDATTKDAYDRLIEASRISEVAPECERRARTGIKAAAVHVGYLPAIGEEDGRPLLTHYFAHDTVVLCHPSYPGEDEAMIFVALRQTSSGDHHRYLCYRRSFVDDDTGAVVSWGPWEVGTWDSGRDYVDWAEYEGLVVPVAALRLEPPDGGYWPAAERDSYLLSDGLNTSRANAEYITDLQAHSNLVIASATYDESEQSAGPDAVIKLRDGTASWITPTPALTDMRDSIAEKQRSVGASRGNDPNSYSSEPDTSVESGVARMVAQFPHELTLREARESIRRFDERLCRILLDVADAYDPDLPAFGLDVRPRTELASTVVFEDPAAKQARALINLQEGAISPAEYATDVGITSSKAAAIEAGYSDVARMREPIVAPSITTALVDGTAPVESGDAPGQ